MSQQPSNLPELSDASAPALTLQQISEVVAANKLRELDDKALTEAAHTVTAARIAVERGEAPADPTIVTEGHLGGFEDPFMIARNAIWRERAVRTEHARLMDGWDDEAGRAGKSRAMRDVAERLVNLAYMANAIDEDDGIASARRAPFRDGGREQFDRLAGDGGKAGAARIYVAMRQHQRNGENSMVQVAAAFCNYTEAGFMGYDEALAALHRDGLTKRMRDGRAQEAPKQVDHPASPPLTRPAERGITFEGTDLSGLLARKPHLAANLLMPGDRARIDDDAAGSQRDGLRARLGDNPVVVSRTVVKGGTTGDLGVGHTTMTCRYEFEDIDGRFDAERFQHERGGEHAYGAMLVKNDRLWLVPIKNEGRNPAAAGPAREITSAVERYADTLLPSGSSPGAMTPLAGKVYLESGPVLGEFKLRPQRLGQKDGPVELVSVQRTMPPSKAEAAQAHAAVEKAERAELGLQAAVHAALRDGFVR